MRGVLLVLVCAVMLAGRAAAQDTPVGRCLDRRLKPIPVLSSTHLPMPAAAGMDGGHPVIFWNPHSQLGSYLGRTFVYLHECAHITLRHVQRVNPTVDERFTQELEADCWAVQMMVEGEMIHGAQRQRLFRELATTAPDETHLSGDARIASLERCLASKTNPRLWRIALDSLAAASVQGFAALQGPAITEVPGHRFYEALIDLPGTYDCEIREGPSVLCMIFAAQSGGPVRKRFRTISAIVRGWMGRLWTARETGGSLPRLEAQDSRTGAQVTLFATADHRIYFIYSRAQEPVLQAANVP